MADREPVIDFVPPGTPPITTDRIDAAIEDVRASGLEAAAWEAMLDEQVRELREDPALGERLRDVYRDAGVDVICATVWTTDPTTSFLEGTYRDLARWKARFEALDWLHEVTTPAAARRVAADGDVGIVLGTQNLGEFTAGDVDRAEALFDGGLRLMQPTYNRANHMGAGCNEPPGNGLTDHGAAVVRRLNDLGAVIDLSHCNERTTLDTVEASEAPVAYTHTHCGALHDHPRSTSDEAFEALAANDGYAGILVYPHHYDEPTFETFFEHFDHATSILGPDRVGVATDWCITTPDVPDSLRPALVAFFDRETTSRGRSGGMGYTPDRFEQAFEGISAYADRSVVRGAFEDRGYGDDEIGGFLGGNLLALWERVREA